MSALQSGHLAIPAAFARHQVQDVVVGGIALQLLGTTHVTKDVDVTVAIDEDNRRRIEGALAELDAWPSTTGQLGTMFETKYGQLELLRTTSGVGPDTEWIQRAELREVDGIEDPDRARGPKPTDPARLADHEIMERSRQRTRTLIDRTLEPPGPDLGR